MGADHAEHDLGQLLFLFCFQVFPAPRDADYSEDDEDYGLPEDIGLDDEDEDGFDGSDDEPV